MLVGYARVSTTDQHIGLQCDALRVAGVEKIFEDSASGVRADRPGLREGLEFIRPGDILVVWRLDRLGRSLPDWLKTVGDLEARGVGFRSLTENIDTSTASGRLAFNLFASLSAFERDLLRERVAAGISAFKDRGGVSGRPRSLTPDKVVAARRLLESGSPPRERLRKN